MIKNLKLFDIKISIHWSFGLLLIWVGFVRWQATENWHEVFIDLFLVLSMFFCVALHELGHALMARFFKIKTHKIVVLPIGGLAQLEKNPQNAKQELFISLAGPATNFAIVILLSFLFAILVPKAEIAQIAESLQSGTLDGLIGTPGFLLKLMAINFVLFVFNLIPAFPMDGGRVLRALIELFSNHQKATKIATLIGQAIAVAFFVFGLYIQAIGLVIIGAFIFFSAQREKVFVSKNKGRTSNPIGSFVKDSMPALFENQQILSALEDISKHTENHFIVLDSMRKVVGTVSRDAIVAKVISAGNDTSYVSDILQHIDVQMDANTNAEDAYNHMQSKGIELLTVFHENEFIGVVELNSLHDFFNKSKMGKHDTPA